MEHKYIENIRGKVHYWVNRNSNPCAPCIVFTHGLTANHEMFCKQIEYFEKDYTVITWDVPLHGQSRPYKDFSYKNSAKDLKHILDNENIKEAILVGMSMGGYPSQAFALEYPKSTLAFIALDTTPFNPTYYSKSDQWWLKHVEPLAKLFSDRLLRKSIAKQNSRTAYGHELLLKMLKPLSKSEIIEQMGVAYGSFLDECRCIRLQCPVTILLGEYDKTGKVRQYCEEWARNEKYPLHIIKNAAHFSNADNAQEVNGIIHDFILGL